MPAAVLGPDHEQVVPAGHPLGAPPLHLEPEPVDIEPLGGGEVLPDRATRIERVVLLGEVAEPQPVPAHHPPGAGDLPTREELQQGGLARSVETEHDQPAAPVHREIHAVERRPLPVRLGERDRAQRCPAAGRGLGQPDAGDPLGPPLVALPLGEVRVPAGVVDVERGPSRVEVEHPVDRVGEEPYVMADQYETTAVGGETAAQPADRVGVQVVGRLVEQRGVLPAVTGEEDPGQFDPAFPAAGQQPDGPVHDLGGQAEACGDTGGPVRAARREDPVGDGHRRVGGP